MSVSIFIPKAFSMRSAMSPERCALPLSKLDSAGRDTRSAAAAAVTVSPAGSIISARMNSPRWGGFFIGMAFLPFIPVVVLQVLIADFVRCAVDAERQTAVAGNARVPCDFAVAGTRVHLLYWK